MEDPPRLEPPLHGFKIPLDYKFPINTKQTIDPKPRQALSLLTLTMRYLAYYVDMKMHNRRPNMDYITQISAQRIYGCPIGGIGGGTIGRGFRGEFCRFHLYPGLIHYINVPECQFIVNIRNADNDTIFQSVMSTYDKPKKAPESWQWNIKGSDCQYTALYPRAWTTYDLSKYGVKLVCRQVSPVIPHNYKDSSLPCSVFVWSATNVCEEPRTVSVTFTWKEIVPGSRKAGVKLELERYSESRTSGVSLEQKINNTPCTFTIAKRRAEHESIHENYCMYNTRKKSVYVWQCLRDKGRLEPEPDKANLPPTKDPKEKAKENKSKPKEKKPYAWDGMGLSSSVSLEPGVTDSMEFCLSWDMPNIKFRDNDRAYRRIVRNGFKTDLFSVEIGARGLPAKSFYSLFNNLGMPTSMLKLMCGQNFESVTEDMLQNMDRYYTKYFGNDGLAGAGIAAYALNNYKRWEKELDAWQDPILNNSNIPDWLKSALMNELYYVADGGSIWFDTHEDFPDTDPRHLYGVFGYLEGHEYRMYNTYDVHFYASFALAQLWPNLQVVIQYMFLDTIQNESSDFIKALYDGKSSRRKVKDSIPHDLGDPDEAPFTLINSYNVHDVSEWRDLNAKFILQVMRDHRLLKNYNCLHNQEDRYNSLEFIDDVRDGSDDDLYERSTRPTRDNPCTVVRSRVEKTKLPNGNVDRPLPVNILDMLYSSEPQSFSRQTSHSESEPERPAVWAAECYAADMYPACAALVRRMRAWDKDGDGLIENTGAPDQTFDAWVMTGPSAYCGGLWLTALFSVKTLANMLNKPDDEAEFDAMLKRAVAAYESKLWNGSYYSFDTLTRNSRVVMSAQLCGQWYLRAAGFTHEVLPKERVCSALRAVFDNNVMKFRDGKLGAVNGYVVEKNGTGHVDHIALQSEEMWTGVTYGLAALMVHEGMTEQAWRTAGGLYRTMSRDMGLNFETPEALTENGNHRSVAYMRPLSIWAIYHAITMTPELINDVGGSAAESPDTEYLIFDFSADSSRPS